MEDTRKEYIPPEAEIILLAPTEKLASSWYIPSGNGDDGWLLTPYATEASAITAGNNLYAEEGTGFVFPRK